MSGQNRRRFLQSSLAAGATFAISGTKSSGNIIGANDRLRVAVAGLHGRGRSHYGAYARMKDVEVAYVVDPDTRQYARAIADVKNVSGRAPKPISDIRQVLDDKELNIVSIATPNHWHSLMSIWACQAGKDVYVEKPLSHNISEGRKLVEAARKYGRMVQHGTQQRSSGSRANEIAALHTGKYGKLTVSKGYCCKPRWSIGEKPQRKPPKELDFNMWLGPAEDQPYHDNLVHYNWHWFWDTGNGDTGNQGVHQMDVARWAIPGATLPKSIVSMGGRFGYDDQGQTPNTQVTVMEYDEALLLFETRGLVGKHKGMDRIVTNEFYTTEGMMKDGTFYPKNGGKPVKVQGPKVEVTPGGAFGSFIHAVRSRKVKDLNADVLEGHYSSALCHLCNISYRLGASVPFNSKTGSLGDNKEVVASLEKIRDNVRTVGHKLEETTYFLGRSLQMDPKAEKFIDDADANALLTRNYRKPFVVPETV
ncbi:MAG: dehydrogenase [Planctomycetaceae bacterium]|nr:dehydrogenase [Planctomycetaceae bacterium]MDP7276388.1 Gfo/Idh/MocA family oxidoreductase [Planctomycetaceae bacterium]